MMLQAAGLVDKKQTREAVTLGFLAISFAIASFYLGGGVHLSVMLYAALFLLLAFVWHFFPVLAGVDYRLTWPHLLVFSSLIWFCFSLLWSLLPTYSFHFVWEYSFFVLTFLVLVNLSGKSWRQLFAYLLLPMGVSAIWGLVEFSQTLVRANGPMTDPNLWAAISNMAFFALAAQFMRSDRKVTAWRNIIVCLILCIFALALFSAYSRVATSVHFAALGLLSLAGLYSAKFRHKAVMLLAVSMLSFVIIHSAATQEEASHNEGYTFDVTVSSWTQRLAMWSSAWSIYTDHPVLGSGLATFKSLYQAYRSEGDLFTRGNFAHNDYLEMLAEGGPVSLAFYLMLVAYLLYWLWFYLRRLLLRKNHTCAMEAIVLILAMGTALTHALMSFVFHQIGVFMMMAVLFSRLVYLNRHRRIATISVNHPGLMKPALPMATAFVWMLLLMDTFTYGLVFKQKGIPYMESIRNDAQLHLRLMKVFKVVRSGNSINHMDLARIYQASIELQKTQQIRETLTLMSAYEFEQAIEDNSRYLPILYYYADLLEKYPWLQKVKELNYTPEKIYDHALAVAPSYVETWTRKARYMEKHGQSREAYELLQKGLPWLNVMHERYKEPRLQMLTLLSRLARQYDDKKMLEEILRRL